MDNTPADDFAAEQLKLSNSLLDAPEAKAKEVKPLQAAATPATPATPAATPAPEPALDDFAKEQLAMSESLVTPVASTDDSQSSYIDDLAALGPDKMDESHWEMVQSETDPYQIENINKRMPWALNESQVRILAGHHRTKDPAVEAAMSPHKDEGVIWPVIKDLAVGVKTYAQKMVSPVKALYDIGGEGMNDWNEGPSAESLAKYKESLKDPLEAARASGASIIETTEDVANSVSRIKAEGSTWWDRGLEWVGDITPEEADDNFVRRHAITAYNELFKAKNPSEYARAVEYSRPLASWALNKKIGAMNSIVGSMTPDVDDILATYSQRPEYANMTREEAVQIKKKQDKEVAQAAISDMVKDLNENALVDPSLKSFTGLVTPLGNVFSVIELGAAGALKAASAAGRGIERVSLGLTKAEMAARMTAKAEKATADAVEKAAQMGPLGNASTKVADMIDAGGSRLTQAIEVIPEGWRPYVAGAVGLGGAGGVGALIGSDDRQEAAKKWGTNLGYAALALSAPRLASDYFKGASQLAGRGFEGAALSGSSSKLTKALLQGGEKITLSPRWPKMLDSMADFAKYTAETGIRFIPLTAAAGALADETAEELQKSYVTGLVYGFGGRWLGLATGKDPGKLKDQQFRQDFDYKKEIKKQSPETQARYELLRSYDNEIQRRKNNLDWAESHLQQTVKDVGMDNKFYQEAAANVLQARKNLKKSQEASPEERAEYSRLMGNVFSDASAVINGTVKGGSNVNIEILTEAEIEQKMLDAGASKGMTPEFAKMAARQRGAYFADGVVTLPNGNQVKVFDRNAVVINQDKLRRNQEFSGRSFAHVFQHEVGHALENFQEYRELNQSARDDLFGKQHKGPNGEILSDTPGLYSEEDLVANYTDTYMGRKTPQQQETWLKQNGLWDWTKNEPNNKEIAEVQKEEIIADLNARGLSGGIKYSANSPIQAVVDWVTAKHDNSRLAQAMRDLAGLNEPGPFSSEYTGAHFSPKVQEANRRALQAAADLNGNFRALTKIPKPKISRADIIQNAKLREHYMTGTQYYKEGFMAVVYDKNDNPVQTVMVQSPGAKEGEWRHAVDQNGNSTLQQTRGFGTLPSELGDIKADWTGAPQGAVEGGPIRVPEGGRVAVERKIVVDENGKPVENDRKDRKMLSKARAQMFRDALDSTPDLGAPGRMQAVSDDGLTYRGRLTPLQRKAIQDLPEGVIPLSIKEKFLNLSDMIGQDDGTPVIADYANRMDVNGNYVAFSPKLIEFVPIGLHFSKAGNLLVTTISIDGLHDKLNLWKKYMPERLAPWNYDSDAFMRQFMTYLGNWEAGLEAQTSHANLDANPQMAQAKKNIFNDLLNMVDKETKMKNPDRTNLPKVKLTPEEKADGLSSDPNTVVRSRRLDSIASMEASAGEKYRIPYQYAKQNWMAEGAPEVSAGAKEKPVGPIGIGLGAVGGQRNFYSKAGEVLLSKMPERASYEQLRNMLDPARGSGVKPDELKWSGILPYIERVAQEKGQVSKADIQEFLKEGYGAKFTEETMREAKSFEGEFYSEAEEWGDTYKFGTIAEAEKVAMEKLGLTKEEAEEFVSETNQIDSEYGEDQTRYSQYKLPGGSNYQETVLQMPGVDYTSSHFGDVPNYVAHMRTADHGTGRLIEEAQSDLHQKARKEGYEKLPDTTGWMAGVDNRQGGLFPGNLKKYNVYDQQGAYVSSVTALSEQEAIQKGAALRKEGVADAPFRKDWPLQLFKRALTKAVADGKEWIGWTGGEAQADRYDLSKNLSQIWWNEQSGELFAYDKSANKVIHEYVSEEKLPGFIGETLTQSLVNSEKISPDGFKGLSELDLKVGGEGMEGFYDVMLPKEIGRYVKQWGATVEKAPLETKETSIIKTAWDQPNYEYTNNGWTSTETGESLPIDSPESMALSAYIGMFQESQITEAARQILHSGDIIGRLKDTVPIWKIAITPEMREGVKRGQPLFMAESQEAGNDPYKMSAIHKISEEGLKFADKMGGLSVPSIAVVKSGTGIQGFGNITLVGTRGLADPKSNPVFGGDAYTQRFPKPEYPRVKQKVAQGVIDRFKDVQKKYSASYGDNVTDIIWDNAVNKPNPEEAINKMRRSNVAKAAFLGDEAPEPKVRPVPQNLGILDTEAMKDWMSRNSIESLGYDDMEGRKELGSVIRQAFGEVFPENIGKKGQVYANRFVDDDGNATVHAMSQLESDARKHGQTEVDSYATQADLDNALKGREAEFNAWVDETIQGMYSDPRIRVSGKLEPYTLENIAKVMTSGKTAGVEKSMTQSTGLTAAEMARRFGDLNEMRNTAEAPWGIRGETEVNDARGMVAETLRQYRDSVTPYHEGSTWNALDDAMSSLSTYYKMGAGGEKQMRQALSKNGFKSVPSNIVQGAVDAYRTMKGAPVKYFESKPQRIVELNEFQGAIVPDNVDPSVLDVLRKNGIEFRVIPSEKAEDSDYIGSEISKLKGGPESQEKSGIRFMSEEHAAAHKAGDEEKARTLVRQAAQEAGYTIGPVYHGTSSDKFNKFEPGRASAIYFTDNLDYAKDYGNDIYESFLKGNIADLTDPNSKAYKMAVEAFNEAGGYSESDAMEGRESSNFNSKTDNTWEIFDNPDTDIGGVLMEAGYDALKLQERGAGPGEELIVSYAVFDPEQVKSADPFTYDDQGKLIPLSERFNPSKSDIRFMAEKPPVEIDPGDKDTIPVYQAREDGKLMFSNKKPVVAIQEYELMESPLIQGYNGPGPKDSTLVDFSKLAYDVSGPAQNKINSAVLSGAVDYAATKMVDQTREWMKDPSIAAGMGWYGRMRVNLLTALGPDGRELLSQLLGATSAQTPVDINFLQAMDAYEGVTSGRYNQNRRFYLEMKALEEKKELNDAIQKRGYIDVLKQKETDLRKAAKKMTVKVKKESALSAASNLKYLIERPIEKRSEAEREEIMALATDMMPLRSNGQKFNANSGAVMKVIAGTWLDNRSAPKTPNFAGNLSGRTVEATIDLWAGRTLRRLMYDGYGVPYRIQPKAEGGVSNGDFALGQEIMRRAAAELKMNPDDLQAVLWFGEKGNWENKGWTKNAGAEKSSFDKMFNVFFPQGGKPLTFKEASDMFAAEKQIKENAKKEKAKAERKAKSDAKKAEKLANQSTNE